MCQFVLKVKPKLGNSSVNISEKKTTEKEDKMYCERMYKSMPLLSLLCIMMNNKITVISTWTHQICGWVGRRYWTFLVLACHSRPLSEHERSSHCLTSPRAFPPVLLAAQWLQAEAVDSYQPAGTQAPQLPHSAETSAGPSTTWFPTTIFMVTTTSQSKQ